MIVARSVGGVGTSNLTFSGGTIAPLGSCTIRANVSLPVSATVGTYASNTSAVTATVGGLPFTGNIASGPLGGEYRTNYKYGFYAINHHRRRHDYA